MKVFTRQDILDRTMSKADLKGYAMGLDITLDTKMTLPDMLDAYETAVAAKELDGDAPTVVAEVIALPKEIDGIPVIHGDRGALRELSQTKGVAGKVVNAPYYKVFINKDGNDPHPKIASVNDNKVKVPQGKWVCLQEPYVKQLQERSEQTLTVPRPPRPGQGFQGSNETGAVVVNDWQEEIHTHFHMQAIPIGVH